MTDLIGRKQGLSAPQMTVACVWAGVTLCILAWALLYIIGRPTGERNALLSLEDRVEKIGAAAEGADGASAVPKGAICTGDPDTAARSLQAALIVSAQKSRLAAVTATASSSALNTGSLQPLQVALDANGTYPAALALLRGLLDQRPPLLLDRVDLVPMGTYLHLHVSGRAYCWSHAPR